MNGDNESVCSVCIATNNAELFLMPSRLKSHIILVLDRLQCMARVNCLVHINAINFPSLASEKLSKLLDKSMSVSN